MVLVVGCVEDTVYDQCKSECLNYDCEDTYEYKSCDLPFGLMCTTYDLPTHECKEQCYTECKSKI